MTTVEDEVVGQVLTKYEAGTFPDDILEAIHAEFPSDPYVEAWVARVIRDAKTTNVNAIIEEGHRQSDRDELFKRRSTRLIVERIVDVMVGRELERRVAIGEFVARVDENGGICYYRDDD